MTQARPATKPGRWKIVFGCLIVGSAVPNWINYIELIVSMWGKSLSERGHLACDGSRNFLEVSGSIPLRTYPPDNSYVPDIWVWAEQAAKTLPPDARIYINAVSSPLYYLGNFFWYPRHLALSPTPVRIDGLTVENNSVYIPESELPSLLKAGFTHVVQDEKTGPRLIELSTLPNRER